jgi:hypothetical protein
MIDGMEALAGKVLLQKRPSRKHKRSNNNVVRAFDFLFDLSEVAS